MHEALHAFGQLLHERRHVLRSQGAVQAHAHGLGMPDGSIKCLPCLTRQGPARLVHQCARHEYWDVQSTELQVFSHSVKSCLGIQCVEDGFHHQNVRTSVHQPHYLLKVSFHQLVERHIPRRWVLHGRRDGSRAVGRSNGSYHKPRMRRVCLRHFIARLSRKPCALVVQLIRIVLHLIVRHRNRGGRKCVGTNHIRSPNLQILFVNATYHIGTGNGQHVIVALHIALPVLEALPAVLIFLQLILFRVVLDHSAHSAIVKCDAGREQLGYVLTHAVPAPDKMRERFRIQVGRLCVVNVNVLASCGRLGANLGNLLVAELRVCVVVGHLIPGHIR
mmetsp:Transcript_869/g.1374  ORF Transcript_869/g.1374 Transcript_869/m.1374 type:complete len:333 (-) Transcript_869:103-1101(-)